MEIEKIKEVKRQSEDTILKVIQDYEKLTETLVRNVYVCHDGKKATKIEIESIIIS